MCKSSSPSVSYFMFQTHLSSLRSRCSFSLRYECGDYVHFFNHLRNVFPWIAYLFIFSSISLNIIFKTSEVIVPFRKGVKGVKFRLTLTFLGIHMPIRNLANKQDSWDYRVKVFVIVSETKPKVEQHWSNIFILGQNWEFLMSQIRARFSWIWIGSFVQLFGL